MQLSGYIKLIILLLCLFSLSGCVTFDDYYAHIAGTRIYDITKAKSDGGFGNPDRIEYAANGNEVWVFKLRDIPFGGNKDCTLYFEANDQEIIVNYWHKGVCVPRHPLLGIF
jgi:hypothetical protein